MKFIYLKINKRRSFSYSESESEYDGIIFYLNLAFEKSKT